MTLEEIQAQWSKDAPVDRTDLASEASRIPQMHSKYFKIFSVERLLLRKLEQESKQLWKDLWEYYQGNFDYEELKERGWDQINQRILKSDLNIYIDSNQNWIDNNLKVLIKKKK